ncbi:BTAD domain-containing putative transcriptional regulator [Spirillospora sp. NPDC029432]|uniref:ATP-binding protein n=1 Tax=Spirillospora sp. NPDC029432 TaxID=3154599 RepID=UPI0034553999
MTPELTLLPRVAFRGREIAGPRLRNLLALLAADLRAGRGTARLVEDLWPDDRPANPAKALQVLVSRARAQLGADVIVSTPAGYRLALGEERVDAAAVLLSAAESARCSRAGDHAAALAHAEDGLALWDGPPALDAADRAGAAGMAGIENAGDAGPGDPLTALRLERAATYHALVRARALALARLGRHEEAAGPLAGLVAERPRDEELLAGLLRCEAATAGPAAALARYDAYRRGLRDELGTDPGAALKDVYEELLRAAAPAVRHGIPHEPNRLLGRDADLAAVSALLRTSRVVSITGPGGLGKTRLAHAAGRAAEQRLVHFVPLAGVERDEDVAAEIAAALGGAGRTGRPADVLAGIAAVVGQGPALLVLDNCEHVVQGAAAVVGALVAMTRELRVLTTSRAPLCLSAEAVYPLPELDAATAAELFRRRARAARPGVELPEDAVAGLCRRLDGLPLAIELAAARVRVMSVPEIARGLDDRFALLRGGPRDAPERHRTLRAVVDWSWNLLGAGERAALRALSVFPGGFSAAAAEYVIPGGDVLDTLERLVDQSLLAVADTGAGLRFRMLETVREFSAARREEAGATGAAAAGFLEWARDFAAGQDEPLFGREPGPAVDRFRAEQDNLVQAVRLGLDRRDTATVAAVATSLGALWIIESNFVRLAGMCAEIAGPLTRVRPGPEEVERVRGALMLCVLCTYLLEGPRAVRALVALRRLPPAVPDTLSKALATVLAAAPELHGPEDPVLLAMCASEHPMMAGVACAVASHIWENAGEPERALEAAERMLAAFQRGGNPLMEVMTRARLGELCLQTERSAAAERHVLAALPTLERLGDLPDVASIRWSMTLASLQQGRLDAAGHWLEQARLNGADDTYGAVPFAIGVQAEIALARGDTEEGLGLWRTAVRQSPGGGGLPSGLAAGDPWTLEVRAMTVIAHAYAGRLDAVLDVAGMLPHDLAGLLASPLIFTPTPSFAGFPLCGALLLALGLADIARGDRRGGARLVALAERFRFSRAIQPTMASRRAREAAENAGGPAYADAVSEYAGLDRRELRDAALELLRARPRDR